MDTSLNILDPMVKSKKWLSVGAGLGGLVVVLVYIAFNNRGSEDLFWRHLLGLAAAPGTWLKEVLLGLLFFGISLIAVISGAVAGARYICKRIGDSLIGYPPPVLFVGGFFLGVLVIAVGVIYIVYTIVNELF